MQVPHCIMKIFPGPKIALSGDLLYFCNVRHSLGDLLSSLFRRNWKVSWIWIWFVPRWFPSINISCNLHFFQNFLPPLFFKTNQKWARYDRNVVFINEDYHMSHTSTTFTFVPLFHENIFFSGNEALGSCKVSKNNSYKII